MKKQKITAITRLYSAIFSEKLKKPVTDEVLIDITDEVLEKFYQVIGTLTEREQKVLGMRFGYGNDDGEPRCLVQIAKDFNVTAERIRQIEGKAIRKLRRSDCRDRLPRIFQSETVKEQADKILREIQELHKDPVFRREAELCEELAKLRQSPFVLSKEAGLVVEEFSDIDELDLSVRAYNCLRRAGILTIANLRLREAELDKIPLLGKKAADEVRAKMVQKGLV